LLLFKCEEEYVGFVHMKIDKDERPGWGFILEFYIVPDKRKKGWGRRFYNLVANIMRYRGTKNIWLLARTESKPFWFALGFRETGEIDKETSQKVMAISI